MAELVEIANRDDWKIFREKEGATESVIEDSDG